MKSKELTKPRIDTYLKYLKKDMSTMQFEEEERDGKKLVTMRIGKFFFRKEIEDDYESSVKRLFEDFMTNTSYYYIRNFWEL